MLKSILIYLIKIYIKYISPFKLKPACRFYPTCSRYAIESLKKYGVIKGSIYSIWRVLRCNPFNKGGVDLVK